MVFAVCIWYSLVVFVFFLQLPCCWRNSNQNKSSKKQGNFRALFSHIGVIEILSVVGSCERGTWHSINSFIISFGNGIDGHDAVNTRSQSNCHITQIFTHAIQIWPFIWSILYIKEVKRSNFPATIIITIYIYSRAATSTRLTKYIHAQWAMSPVFAESSILPSFNELSLCAIFVCLHYPI